MPNVTVYLSESDLVHWNRAKDRAEGGMGRFVVRLLRLSMLPAAAPAGCPDCAAVAERIHPLHEP